MKPLADFVCNSKKCRTKQGAPVFELPINAVCCPMGHRQIVRLFNRVNVRTGSRARAPDNGDMRHTSSSKAARIDQLARPAMDAADRKLSDYRRTLSSKFPLPRAVPMRQLGTELGKVYAEGGVQGAPAIDQRLLTQKAQVSDGSLGVLDSRQGAAIPTIMNAKDPEYRVARTADGTPTIEKAG